MRYKLIVMTHKELNRLKLLLVEKKKIGLWLAEQLGKDKTTISKWCTNSSQPDVECLIKISKLLNVELSDILIVDNEDVVIGQLITDQFDKATLEAFLTVQFTHHYEILRRSESINERLFYIRRVASEFWSVDKLKYNIREQLYLKEGTMPNNFAVTLSDDEQKQKAMRAFRKNYKLDFIEIDDVDEWGEHKVEVKIVENIKRFIMALGADFSYMGNQYRLIVDDKEYFIDLLFFNRRLRCLVAIELKWTEFLPEYVGKMNFYLSALDDLVRLPNENPSIGIILCRGQKQRTVEYALRDTRKPMGVATYRAANELPEEYGEVLGGLEGLKELM